MDADNPIELKRIVLHIYLSLLTGYKQYYDNPIVDHLMAEDLFEHLIRLLGIPKLRQQLGELSALVISLLVHFEKSAQVNLFTVKLSILDNEVALNGFAQIICAKLAELNRAYEQKHQHKNAGILSFLTSRMGTMWVRDESVTEDTSLPDFDVFLLLSFYDLVHLSRNFFSLLISAHTDLPEEHYEQESPKTPTNLMVNFLEYCSICMLCNKEKTSSNTLRLCFVILCCITEDQCANALLHDTSLAFKVPLHRVQMRHRKLAEQSDQICRPLAYSLLDLMCEFISSNMRKEFPLDLYLFTVNVIHRLLCYQKRCKIRHEYDWVSLWHTLISLLKYLLQNEELFVKRQMNIFLLAHNVITLLNLSITFGDTFLHSPNAYDELYYEIIRMHQVFNKLLALGMCLIMVDVKSFNTL